MLACFACCFIYFWFFERREMIPCLIWSRMAPFSGRDLHSRYNFVIFKLFFMFLIFLSVGKRFLAQFGAGWPHFQAEISVLGSILWFLAKEFASWCKNLYQDAGICIMMQRICIRMQEFVSGRRNLHQDVVSPPVGRALPSPHRGPGWR